VEFSRSRNCNLQKLPPQSVTDFGIVKTFKEVQPSKACLEINFMVFGIVTLFKEVQDEKAPFQMSFTELGISTL
jgi:hypothetical protein